MAGRRSRAKESMDAQGQVNLFKDVFISDGRVGSSAIMETDEKTVPESNSVKITRSRSTLSAGDKKQLNKKENVNFMGDEASTMSDGNRNTDSRAQELCRKKQLKNRQEGDNALIIERSGTYATRSSHRSCRMSSFVDGTPYNNNIRSEIDGEREEMPPAANSSFSAAEPNTGPVTLQNVVFDTENRSPGTPASTGAPQNLPDTSLDASSHDEVERDVITGLPCSTAVVQHDMGDCGDPAYDPYEILLDYDEEEEHGFDPRVRSVQLVASIAPSCNFNEPCCASNMGVLGSQGKGEGTGTPSSTLQAMAQTTPHGVQSLADNSTVFDLPGPPSTASGLPIPVPVPLSFDIRGVDLRWEAGADGTIGVVTAHICAEQAREGEPQPKSCGGFKLSAGQGAHSKGMPDGAVVLGIRTKCAAGTATDYRALAVDGRGSIALSEWMAMVDTMRECGVTSLFLCRNINSRRGVVGIDTTVDRPLHDAVLTPYLLQPDSLRGAAQIGPTLVRPPAEVTKARTLDLKTPLLQLTFGELMGLIGRSAKQMQEGLAYKLKGVQHVGLRALKRVYEDWLEDPAAEEQNKKVFLIYFVLFTPKRSGDADKNQFSKVANAVAKGD